MENKETVPDGKIVQIMSMSRSGIWDWFTPDKDLQDGCLQEAIAQRLPHRLIPTPAVDELNLEEALDLFDKEHDSYSRIDLFKAGANWQFHHNYASFVALVEGEIAKYKSEYDINGIDDDFVIWQYLQTRFLTKIKL